MLLSILQKNQKNGNHLWNLTKIMNLFCEIPNFDDEIELN